MSQNPIPEEIDRIFDKPGRDWTPEDIEKVFQWLFEPRQYRYLLRFIVYIVNRTLYKAGLEMPPEHAEDVFGEYVLILLQRYIARYDPSLGRRFWGFLLEWLEYYCLSEGKQIIKGYTISLSRSVPTEEGEELELDFPASGLTPDEVFELREIDKELRKCINGLAPQSRRVVVLYYFEEKSVREIAVALGITESYVKVILFRARHELAACLRKKGIEL